MIDKPERRAIISGVGQSAIGRRLFRTDLDLTCDAALNAITDAGLTPDDIDGIAAYPGPIGGPPGFAGPGIYEVQECLGIDLGWHLSGAEGPAQISPIIHAMLAVAAGLCRHALVYRTVSEATAAADTGRLGIGVGSHEIRGFGAFLIPFGAMSAANWLALYARRHMYEFGTTREHMGLIATTARRHAGLNPSAIYRDPMSMEDYLNARMVTDPFGLYDCDVPCDGSTAVIVSRAEIAHDLPHRAVRFEAVGSAIRARPSWDQWEDITTMSARDAAEQLWTRTDLKPADVDTAQLYDGFSIIVFQWLEALGFCGEGEAAAFVREGNTRLGGSLPVNTDGGACNVGRRHGANFCIESTRQLRGGQSGERQVEGAEVAVWTNAVGPFAAGAILTKG